MCGSTPPTFFLKKCMSVAVGGLGESAPRGSLHKSMILKRSEALAPLARGLAEVRPLSSTLGLDPACPARSYTQRACAPPPGPTRTDTIPPPPHPSLGLADPPGHLRGPLSDRLPPLGCS